MQKTIRFHADALEFDSAGDSKVMPLRITGWKRPTDRPTEAKREKCLKSSQATRAREAMCKPILKDKKGAVA